MHRPCDQYKQQAWIAGRRPEVGASNAASKEHNLRKSGDILWCARCGAFAQSRAMTLYKACIPPVRQFGTGGRVAQLRRLRGNRHPVTDAPLPPPVDLEGNPITSQFGYARLGRRDIGEKDSEFKAYIPEDLVVPQPAIAIRGQVSCRKVKGEADESEAEGIVRDATSQSHTEAAEGA